MVQTVMGATDQDKVFKFGLATIDPVDDVMGFEVPGVATAREPAAPAITDLEGALQPRRDNATATLEIQDVAGPILNELGQIGIATDLPRR
jgi:hypothetical protein